MTNKQMTDDERAETLIGLRGLFSAMWEKLRPIGEELDREEAAEATKKKLEKLEDQDA